MTIEAMREKVWKVISSEGNLEYCHPFCKNNPVSIWGKVGAKDMIEYYNGLTLHREFSEWTEGVGYKLNIGQGKYATATVFWEIENLGEKRSTLSIKINLYTDVALANYPRLLRKPIIKYYFIPHMFHYVKSVVNGFKYYIETGKPVQKNQFGVNKMFSNN